jgi:hypothetical protein
MQVGLSTITLAAAAKDAGGIGKNGQTIRFTLAPAGIATPSATTLTTGVTGSTANVTLTPNTAGTVVVTADWLDSSGAVSVTATKSIDVTAAQGIAFDITTPIPDPKTNQVAVSIGAAQSLAVTVPAKIAGTDVASVQISSTAGTWTGVTQVTAPAVSISQTPVANAVAATFTAPNNSGVVTVQVDALTALNASTGTKAVLSSLTRSFVISAQAGAAAKLTLQTSVATIAPSSGANASTATLTATVRDASNNAVGGAAVAFELLGTTGSGESISPAVAYSDGSGKAVATFSAGSSTTSGPIYAQARVVGGGCPGNLCSSTQLIVSATAVSITIGFGTTISSIANDTMYSYPGSVLVVDANGSPAANTVVTLTLFPVEYRNATILAGGTGCYVASIPDPLNPGFFTALPFAPNEDTNRNGILDPAGVLGPAEDVSSISGSGLTLAPNTVISPTQAAGGTVPATVTTDSNGVATFNLQYPKESAFRIKDELTARVTVSGTERSAQTTLVLTPSEADGATKDKCPLAGTKTY